VNKPQRFSAIQRSRAPDHACIGNLGEGGTLIMEVFARKISSHLIEERITESFPME